MIIVTNLEVGFAPGCVGADTGTTPVSRGECFKNGELQAMRGFRNLESLTAAHAVKLPRGTISASNGL